MSLNISPSLISRGDRFMHSFIYSSLSLSIPQLVICQVIATLAALTVEGDAEKDPMHLKLLLDNSHSIGDARKRK